MDESWSTVRWKLLVFAAFCSLTLAEPPRLTRAPSAESFTTTSVTVSYPAFDESQDQGSGPVVSYEVKARKTSGIDEMRFSGTPSRLVTVQPLESGEEYSIVVECFNAAGGSNGDSPALIVTIPCSAPSEPVATVELETVNTTSLRLTWTAPPQSSWGCSSLDDIMLNYKYKTEMDMDFPEMWVEVPVNDGEVVIGGLDPCTVYDVQVILYSSSLGEFAEQDAMTNGTTELEVVGPINNPNSFAQANLKGQLILTWEAPNGCQPDSYTVNYALAGWLACPDEEIVPEVMEVIDIEQGPYGLTNLEQFARYQLNISGVNALGQGEFVSYTAETPPALPASAPVPMLREDLTVPGELHFNWTTIPCSDIQGTFGRYLGELYTEKRRNLFKNFKKGSMDLTEGSFTGLLGCTEYDFRMRVNNAVGAGPFSDFITVTTPATVPGIVKGLSSTVEPDAPTSLNIMWLPDDMEPCLAESYTLEYALSTRDQCEEANISMTTAPPVMAPDTGLLLEGLEPYSTYQVAVYASNDAGNTSRVERMVYTGEQAPTGTPSEVMATVVEYNRLGFSFEELPCGTRRGMITQYQYELRNTGTGEVTNGTTTTMEVTLDNLERNTEYGIKIRGENGAGVGDYSEEVLQMTAEGFPTMPLSVTTYDKPSALLPVTWSPPAQPKGTIQYYEVEVRNVGTDEAMMLNFNDVNAMPLRLLVTDVKPNMEYEVMVRGINEAGPSNWSDPLAVVILEGAPGPVDELMIEDITEDSITIAWQPPMDPKGAIAKYTVEFSSGMRPYVHRKSRDAANSVEVGPEETSLGLMDLEPATEYIITVWAHTSEARGEGATVQQYTLPPEDLPAPTGVVLLSSSVRDDGTMIIKLPPTSYAYATHYQIGVHCQGSDAKPLFLTGANYSTECSYIAGEVPNMEMDQEFVIGDGKTYNSFENSPLDKERKYDIYVSLVSRTKESSSVSWGAEPLIAEERSPLLVLLWIFIIILLIVILVIFSLCVFNYYRKRGEKKIPPSTPEENVPLE